MSYYHKIADPRKTRVALLEAAKEPLVLLSHKKEIDEIRTKKQLLVIELQDELKDLANLVKKLDKLLPDKDLKEELKKLQKARLEKVHKATKKAAKISGVKEDKLLELTPVTDVDRLEYTLNKIEQKLNELK